MTISETLKGAGYRPSGFDYMRALLALSVICWHSVTTTYGEEGETLLWRTVWWIPFGFILPMFFALSGFLVAGSLERSKSLVSFLGLRLLRIAPALAVETALSALLLGPLFTTLALREYYSHPEFAAYFWNLVGHVHFYLPGVFETNPYRQVNGQLWTVPWEMRCYIVITILALFSIYRHAVWLIIFLALLYVAQAYVAATQPEETVSHGSALVMSFIAGLLFYRLRETIALRRDVFFAAIVICGLLFVTPHGDRFAALPAAYVTVFLGLRNPPRNGLLLSGDYSYGLFLYGMPIQQALVATGVESWWGNLIGAIPCAALLRRLIVVVRRKARAAAEGQAQSD